MPDSGGILQLNVTATVGAVSALKGNRLACPL